MKIRVNCDSFRSNQPREEWMHQLPEKTVRHIAHFGASRDSTLSDGAQARMSLTGLLRDAVVCRAPYAAGRSNPNWLMGSAHEMFERRMEMGITPRHRIYQPRWPGYS